eukprot:COSAG05_NODE_5023_length_1287_cov_1.209596_1_plen_40_part_10
MAPCVQARDVDVPAGTFAQTRGEQFVVCSVALVADPADFR